MKQALDFILNGQATGSVAQRLLASGMNVNTLRPWIGEDGKIYMNVNGQAKEVLAINATLRKDEWKHYDTAVVEAAQSRLIGVADMFARGLIYNIPNGLGSTVLEYEDQSDTEAASLSMDGVVRGPNDRPEYGINYLPLPIIHKDFQINARVLAASRTTGRPLDTTMAALSARKVAEKAEDMLFNGASSYTFGGGTIRGLTDFASRNTYSLTANWDDSASSGATILEDVRSMKQLSIDAKHYGPWMLYIPTNYETTLDDDFKANSDKTIRQRILEVSGILDVKVADTLTADNVVLVEMRPETIRLVQGLSLTTVEWSTEGNMIHRFKVMQILVPQPRADQDGNCGIVHGS